MYLLVWWFPYPLYILWQLWYGYLATCCSQYCAYMLSLSCRAMSLTLLTIRFVVSLSLCRSLGVNKTGLLLPYMAYSVNEFHMFPDFYFINDPILIHLPQHYCQSSSSPTVHSGIRSTPSPLIAQTGIAASLPFHAFFLLLGCSTAPLARATR